MMGDWGFSLVSVQNCELRRKFTMVCGWKGLDCDDDDVVDDGNPVTSSIVADAADRSDQCFRFHLYVSTILCQ